MFGAPPVIETEIFARLPEEFRVKHETPWSLRRGEGPLHSFLEGPSFDRAGNLYVVDIPHSRIFRITPDGKNWSLFTQYEGGMPNGLKIHKDGRIFVADHHDGLLVFDPATGNRISSQNRYEREVFQGLNDLFFGDNGDLYFTDPGPSGVENPVGRVYRIRAAGGVDMIADKLAYSNGLVLSPKQDALYIAVTRAQQVLKAGVKPTFRGHYKYGVFIQLSGGTAGPDGMAVDEEGNLAVAHAGFGSVWLFSRIGEPLARIKSCAGYSTTNIAYGGPDNRDLFITESAQGVILRARMPYPGRKMFSHM